MLFNEVAFSKALQEPLMQPIYQEIVAENCSVLVPSGFNVYTPTFFRTHAVYANPSNRNQLQTLIGTRAFIEEDYIHIAPITVVKSKWDWPLDKSLDIKTKVLGQQDIAIGERHFNVIHIENDIFVEHPTGSVIPEFIGGLFNTIGLERVAKTITVSQVELAVPECEDQEFLALIAVLKKEESEKLCLLIQKQVQLLDTLPIPVHLGHSDTSKLELLADKLRESVDLVASQMPKAEISKNATLSDGIESFLTASIYKSIRKRYLKPENELDICFARKLVLLSQISPEQLGLAVSQYEGIEKMVVGWTGKIIQFEEAKTPISKIKYLFLLFNEMQSIASVNLDFLNQVGVTGDADQVLSLTIFVMIKSIPMKMISSLEYALRLRNPKMLRGHEQYGLVTFQAAIGWINSLDLVSLGFPKHMIEMIQSDTVQLKAKTPIVMQYNTLSNVGTELATAASSLSNALLGIRKQISFDSLAGKSDSASSGFAQKFRARIQDQNKPS